MTNETKTPSVDDMRQDIEKWEGHILLTSEEYCVNLLSEIDRLRAERSDAAQLAAMYKGENDRLNKELLRYKHPFGRKAGDTEITDKLEKLRDE